MLLFFVRGLSGLLWEDNLLELNWGDPRNYAELGELRPYLSALILELTSYSSFIVLTDIYSLYKSSCC